MIPIRREWIPYFSGAGLILSTCVLSAASCYFIWKGWNRWAILGGSLVLYYGLTAFWNFQTLYWSWRWDCMLLRREREIAEQERASRPPPEPEPTVEELPPENYEPEYYI